MKNLPCDALEDFLAGELAADDRAAFEAHLVDCPACRAEVAEWQALCRTLKAATDEWEMPPTDLTHRIGREVNVSAQTATNNGKTWRIAALIAASLLAAVLFSQNLPPTSRPQRDLPPQAEQARSQPAVAATGPTPAAARPSVEIRGKVIGVPIDIGDPKVTVVWLYPEAGGPEAEK